MVIEEHARLEILLPNETDWRYISEDDIIQNTLSITSKCMDDSSFMLGGVFSAQLSAKLRISGGNVNSYIIIGAKINVYSWYGNDLNKEKLRGIFWITSATRINDIYTISASDALVWLDSASYDDREQGASENKIYARLSSGIRDMSNNLKEIIDVVNEVLDEDKRIVWRGDGGVVNNMPSGIGYVLLPPDEIGEISTKNPRDYVSWLAELACGFIFVGYSEGDAWIKIGQYWEEKFIEILPEETELNSCEIADFKLKFNRVYAEIYNGHSGSEHGEITAGGITVDISANPFKDGHWQYHGGNAMDVIGEMFKKLTSPRINFRPFKLKCHKTEFFELGQKVKLPNGEFSLLTGIKWQFRGGYTLSCAGRDTRILSVAAKRSQAAKVKDLAYTKINAEKSKIMKEITSSNSRIETLEASDVSDWNTIQGQIEDIWQAINGG
ncbi:MAG: hypothetical protein K2G14_04935 [Ruminococcus sp.]|nr:hypothetical protein [Ruminococcus sp.]